MKQLVFSPKLNEGGIEVAKGLYKAFIESFPTMADYNPSEELKQVLSFDNTYVPDRPCKIVAYTDDNVFALVTFIDNMSGQLYRTEDLVIVEQNLNNIIHDKTRSKTETPTGPQNNS
jgi:hypothetical protein